MSASRLSGTSRAARVRLATVGTMISLALVIFTFEAGAGSVVAAVGVATAICALAYLTTAMATGGRQPGRSSIVGSVAAVALYAGVALALAAGVGLLVRSLIGEQYAAQFGTRTTVTLSGQCIDHVKEYGSGLRAADRTECADSTWAVDDRVHTGTAVVKWDAYDGTELPAQIDAYALGNEAYSVLKEEDRTLVALWGGAPLWVLWAGLATALTAVIVLARLGWATGTGWTEVMYGL